MLSFAGSVLGRLGPRAHGAVAGVFLALLVAERTSSLFLVTVALTAHRLFVWITYPLVGRWSDRADTRVGRRTPYMAAGLAAAAVCTYLYVRVDGYWALVALIVIARQGLAVYRLPSIAQTPEIFGGSRWVRAAVALGGGGVVVGVSIRLTVIGTWDRHDPKTWLPAYTLAAAFMAFAAVAVLFLVREAPAVRTTKPAVDRTSWRTRVGEILSSPNGKVLIIALFVSIAGAGFTDRAYPIYAEKTLGAGADTLAIAALVAAPLGLTAIPVGYLISRWLTRKQIAIVASLAGSMYAFAHIFVTKLWQSVALGVLSGPFVVAIGIALAPLALQLFPKSGGLAERIGLFAGPIALTGLVASYVSALTYDHLVHDYRIIWVLAGAMGLVGTAVMFWLKVPPGADHTDVRGAIRDIRAVLAERGGSRRLFRGEVTAEDTDGAALIEIIQRRLDPYATTDVPV